MDFMFVIWAFFDENPLILFSFLTKWVPIFKHKGHSGKHDFHVWKVIVFIIMCFNFGNLHSIFWKVKLMLQSFKNIWPNNNKLSENFEKKATRAHFSSKCLSAPTKDSATPMQGNDAEDWHGGQVWVKAVLKMGLWGIEFLS